MKRPIVQKVRLRGPSEIKERMRKAAATQRALDVMSPLLDSLKGQDRELVIEVCRVLIRCLSRVVETKGDIGRAHGVLSGAQTDLTPAYRPEVKGKAAAEALFKGAAG